MDAETYWQEKTEYYQVTKKIIDHALEAPVDDPAEKARLVLLGTMATMLVDIAKSLDWISFHGISVE